MSPLSIVASHFMTTLVSNQVRHLRAKAHHLKPVVLLGKEGLSPAVLAEIQIAIDHHELIKVRVSGDDREARTAVAQAIADQMDACLVQFLGHTVTLFKAKRKDSAYSLPKPNKA